MTDACPARPDLHALADGTLAAERRAGLEAHLLGCSACRDMVRDLRRVETFARGASVRTALDVEAIVARAREQAIPEIIRRAAGRPARVVRLARTMLVAGVFGVVLAIGTVAWNFGQQSARDANISEGGGLAAVPMPLRSPSAAEPLDVQVASIFTRVHEVPVAMSQAEDLLRRRPFADPEIPAGLIALAQRGGPEAEATVGRIVRARDLTGEAAASALAATRSPKVAATVMALLAAGPAEVRQRLVSGLPGDDATRFLLDEWLRFGLPAELEPAFLSREGLAALARRRANGGSRDARLKLWTLVGRLNGDDSVAALEAIWRDGGSSAAVIESLATVGSTRAFEALARRLPSVDDLDEWPVDPETRLIESALKDHADVAGPWLAYVMRTMDRGADRRRLLIAAGLTGSPRVLPELRRALGRSQDRRAAILALALCRDQESIAHLEPLASINDSGTRRRAIRAIGTIGGEDAMRVLRGLVATDRDRKMVVDILARNRDPSATMGLLDSLRFEDTRERAAVALRQRSPAGSPATASYTAWASFLHRQAAENP